MHMQKGGKSIICCKLDDFWSVILDCHTEHRATCGWSRLPCGLLVNKYTWSSLLSLWWVLIKHQWIWSNDETNILDSLFNIIQILCIPSWKFKIIAKKLFLSRVKNFEYSTRNLQYWFYHNANHNANPMSDKMKKKSEINLMASPLYIK